MRPRFHAACHARSRNGWGVYAERVVVSADGNDDRPAGEPVLRVIRGDATPEEIAALVAVVMSRSGDDAAAPRAVRPTWADRSAVLRRPLQAGPGAWRRSSLPY